MLSKPTIVKMFDEQAKAFAEFSQESFQWHHMEKGIYDKYLSDNFLNNSEILDIGSGAGRIMKYLNQRGVLEENITGVDVSSEMVKIAKNRLPGATFANQDIAHLDLSNKNFSLVTSHMVFEFLDNDQLHKTLKQAYDHMAENGTLMYTTTHPNKMASGDYANYKDKQFWIDTSAPWEGGISTFHRPTNDFINATIKAGFHIDRIIEIGFDLSAKEESALKVAKYLKYGPMRLMVMARKLTKVKKPSARAVLYT
ncbi:class I SAM-dependent methyltransferase [Candidatus Parcubacteria bacterium]|nr:class I SAM-dependent methyltransferase [Candidatus Parcubacteria bacterium]